MTLRCFPRCLLALAVSWNEEMEAWHGMRKHQRRPGPISGRLATEWDGMVALLR
jgi:hypothetical protein